MSNSIRKTCVLAKVSIGKQSAYITDKDLTNQLESKYATPGRGKVVKRLWKDSKEFAELQSQCTKISQLYKTRTLQWDDSYRILPAKEFVPFVKDLDKEIDVLYDKVDRFAGNLVSHRDADLAASNGLTKQEDYPNEQQLRDSFYVKKTFQSIPAVEDFRVVEGLDEAEIDELVKQAVESEKQTIMNPVKEAWGRLYKVVNHMKERLTQYQGKDGERLHSSIVNNVKDCVDIMRKLNITNDQSLNDVMDEIEYSVLPTADIERFRVFKQDRDDTVQKVNDILNKMSLFNNNQGNV